MRVENHPLLITAAAVIILGTFLIISPQAAWANPYSGAHVEKFVNPVTGNSWAPVSSIFGYTDFQGTNPSVITSHLLSLVSTAGWNKASDTATGVGYQMVVQAGTDGWVHHDPQVWKLGIQGSIWNCSVDNSCQPLVPITSMNYAYFTGYWSGSSAVVFYTETHDFGGAIVYKASTYQKAAVDTSDAFSVGWVHRSYNSQDWYAKLMEVGAESDAVLSPGWYVHQYGITYYPVNAGTSPRYFANDNVVVHSGIQDTSYFDLGVGSSLSWNPATGKDGPIGGDRSLAGADYNNKPGSSRPAGDILWYQSDVTNYVKEGTSLWGRGSLHMGALQLGDLKAVDGLSIAVRDLNDNGVLLSGVYSPADYLPPVNGVYYVHFNDYGNYFSTNYSMSAPSIVSDFDKWDWGERVKVNVSDRNAHTLLAKFYNQGNPQGYTKFEVRSSLDPSGQLTGMRGAITDVGAGTLWTQGYTNYNVGLRAGINYDVTWNNWSSNNYQYAVNRNGGAIVSDISDNAYCWGGVQRVALAQSGTIYTNTGYFSSVTHC